MPKRGIKKRILDKVGSLFSIRGAKHRLEIHGDQKELDCNSPKGPDINTMHGVLSTLTPQKKPRGIRFSRRAVQRSKYLRQKFGVRKTVMGFSPRVGSITEEDESEINLWMLAENAENVISEGMAWLRNSEDCFDDSSSNQEVDEEKILQMWIESNSFDKIYDENDDKNIYHEDDCDSFSGDDEDDLDEPEQEPSDDDDEHQHPISNDHDSTSDEDIDDDDNINVTQNNQDNINKSYSSNDTGTDSVDDDEANDDGDDNLGDSVTEKSCSIYVDDESFDELDDDDDDDDGDISHKQLESFGTDDCDDDDDGVYSHKQLESSGTDDYDEFRTDRSEDHPKNDCYNVSDSGSSRINIKHTLIGLTNFPSTTDIKNIGDMDKVKGLNLARENTPKFDSTRSENYKHIFVNTKDMSNVSICNKTGSEKIFLRVDGDDNNQAGCKLSHENEDSTGEREATVFVHALESSYDNDDDYYDGDDNDVDINHNHDTSSLNSRAIFNDDLKNNTLKAPQDLDVKILHEETILPEKPLDREINAKECKKIGEVEITPDDAVIGAVKEEIDDILSRISQIESDFNFMRTTMNEFRSSAEQNNDKMQ
ncbi:protein PFC0760c-like [Actinia tenebrosa]|uniref:Protein PFC0760c-like n=1 Tax=Actinia tenebrosa TaxID=6105 RepID=A0A6P8IGM2_ACTTE|nr:protein PFC0760c-like [Actinia tenebrosa]